VRTSPQHRRRDLAGRIIGALAHAVSPHEAESLPVMLQVEVDNTGAIELYHRIGFASSPLRWLSSAGRVINHLRKDAAPDAIE
jgi:predicted GNAT family acetyltransferase